MIFKYLTSIVKPCVFKLFSLRKITKSNFHHHLPTLNIANLFMQSFASPFPQPPHQSPTPQKSRTTNQTPQIYAPPTQKGRNYRLYLRPFYPKIHRKGATIASPQEKSLLNPLNPCEPSPTHKSEIRVSLKCPPTSVRFNTLKSKTCEICGIRVSPKAPHPQKRGFV